MKIWKDVVGFDMYKVSNDGEVFSKYSNKILTPKISTKGYRCLTLVIDKQHKDKIVSRLVAEAFIPNPENKPHVNHISGIKTDDRAENLEWCTPLENAHHAWRTGLCSAEQKRILSLEEAKEIYYSTIPQCKLAKMFNVCQSTISNVKLGINGYHKFIGVL
jgi:hypothetical protein